MEIVAYQPPVSWIREKIEEAGTRIGGVHFNKRENNELRKMTYRLHVKAPSVAKAPKGVVSHTSGDKVVMKWKQDKKVIDKANNQMTVLDTNKVVRDAEGKAIGRGAWRTVPLERVTRIVNNKNTYIIHHSY